MSASTLPSNPVVLELLLGQVTKFLEALEPLVVKYRIQDRMLTEMVHDPSRGLAQRHPFYRQLQDAIFADIASLGPPYSALLPYVESDASDGVLFRETLANPAPVPGLSGGAAEMLRSVMAKHEACYKVARSARRLQASIIAKINNQSEPSGEDVPRETGVSESEERMQNPGMILPGRGKKPHGSSRRSTDCAMKLRS